MKKAATVARWDTVKGIWVGGKAPSSLSFDKIPTPLFIFGYGSLCWKADADIPHDQRVYGFVKGYKRRFWQLSMDHRGTPTAPGLVCTLLETKAGGGDVSDSNDGGVVHGVAYRVPDDRAQEVLNNLDVREKGGYIRALVDVHIDGYGDDDRELEKKTNRTTSQKKVIKALFYSADETNPAFAPAKYRENIDLSARCIAKAQGPSGPNHEYLFNLCDFLRQRQIELGSSEEGDKTGENHRSHTHSVSVESDACFTTSIDPYAFKLEGLVRKHLVQISSGSDGEAAETKSMK